MLPAVLPNSDCQRSARGEISVFDIDLIYLKELTPFDVVCV